MNIKYNVSSPVKATGLINIASSGGIRYSAVVMSLINIYRKCAPDILRKKLAGLYWSLNNLVRHHRLDMFLGVEIETVTRCNRQCGYCPNSRYDRGDHRMPEGLFKKIIDELAGVRFNGRISPHFFGEPLADSRLEVLMRYTRERLPEAAIIIYSNGDLLTGERFDSLVEAGVDRFMITRHAGEPSKVLRSTLDSLSVNDCKRVEVIVHNQDLKLFNRGGLVDIPGTISLRRCFIPGNCAVIDYRGNVVLCCNDYHSSVVFGNVTRERLMDIWNKKRYRVLRRRLRRGKFDLDLCRKCIGSN